MAAGQRVPGLVLDLDASIVICHSQKRIAETWPCATDLATAFGRLAALPRPNS
jgi:hypothetical protein